MKHRQPRIRASITEAWAVRRTTRGTYTEVHMDEFKRWAEELRRMPPEVRKRHLEAAFRLCIKPQDLRRLWRRGS
jgi:hypothetical protein